MRRRGTAGLVALAVLGTGGTCSAPPPWHDLSGSWTATSAAEARTVMIERPGGGTTEAEIGLVMTLESAIPENREPRPVEGWVCVDEDAGLGVAGTYVIDREASTWAGSDYGGARLDVVARADDGRVVEVAQAFMVNSSPDELGDAIISLAAADGETLGAIRFEGFRRADASCP